MFPSVSAAATGEDKKLIPADRSSRRFAHPNCDEKEWDLYLAHLRLFFTSYKVASVRYFKRDFDIRPHLVVRIFDDKFYGLLDSGSSISILGSSAGDSFTRAGVVLQPCKDLHYVATANDSQARVLGYMVLPVTLNDVTHTIKFYVIPDVTTPIIFGVDFWKAFELAPKIFPKLPFENRSVDTPRVLEVKSLHDFDTLSSSQKQTAADVVRLFEDISFEKKGLGRTSLITHSIDTGNTAPIKQRYYCLSPDRLKVLNGLLDEMLEMGVVEPSVSPWNNPVLLVSKANGELRFCLDSRKLNAVSKGDAYPLPYISRILDQLREARYLSSIDLKAAFWQIGLDTQSSREKTAFTVPGRGLFHFVVMCFGLKGAPATQQRLMDRLFGPEFSDKVFVYLDDIVVATSSFVEHITLLRKVFERLREANLTINLKKSNFFRKELKYLGYVVDEQGLRTDPSKVKSIVDYPVPTNRKEVKMFLGTASYYRRFIRNFSSIAAPLNALTSTKRNAPPFNWSEEANSSFEELKSALSTAPVLACPNFEKPFAVHCDASNYGIAGTLTQDLDDGREHPIAYASRSLNKAERNYSATEREALAVVFAIEHFRPYLEGGKQFKVITDHSSLKWFFNLNNPTGRLARWGCRLSPYNFVIEHRKGADNVVPDALSRAVPVMLVQPVPGDPWYNKMLHKCTNSPQACPNFVVRSGKLFRYSKNKFGSDPGYDWKEVVPVHNREALLRANHCSDLAPHFGIFKTYKRLALRYFWPDLYKDVVTFVGNCDVCSAYKCSQEVTPGLMGDPKVTTRPFQTLSIDLVGPLPRSRAGFTYLFVVLCCFTKYCLLFPLRRATGKNIVKHLEDDVFLVHGVPRTVILDNGTQFTGHELNDLFAKYSVPQVHFTPRYCPQVNSVERYNRTIGTALSIMVKDDHRTWDLHVPKIQCAMNSSVNESTRYSPYFLTHGREPILCGTVYGTDTSPTVSLACASRDRFAKDLGQLRSVFERVRTAISKVHTRSKKYYNQSRRHMEFGVGDIVWKKNFPLSDSSKFFMAKLAPKFEKCRVLSKPSPLVYELADAISGKPLGRWHVRNLKAN